MYDTLPFDTLGDEEDMVPETECDCGGYDISAHALASL